MYIVIRRIVGKNKDTQKPIRLYQDVKEAYNFINNYVKESSCEHWCKEVFEPYNLTRRFIQKQLWIRKLKNGNKEYLNIRYMKVY